MGIAINYTLGIWDEGALNEVLQQTKEKALSLGMEIVCHELNKLMINPSEHSESLVFDFKPWREVKEKGDLKQKRIESNLPVLVSKELLPLLTQKELDAENKRYEKVLVCADSCKTQFAGKEIHKHVAELIRLVASRCSFVTICDEGDYYETQDESEAEKNIAIFGTLINEVVKTLSGAGVKVMSGKECLREKWRKMPSNTRTLSELDESMRF